MVIFKLLISKQRWYKKQWWYIVIPSFFNMCDVFWCFCDCYCDLWRFCSVMWCHIVMRPQWWYANISWVLWFPSSCILVQWASWCPPMVISWACKFCGVIVFLLFVVCLACYCHCGVHVRWWYLWCWPFCKCWCFWCVVDTQLWLLWNFVDEVWSCPVWVRSQWWYPWYGPICVWLCFCGIVSVHGD